MQGPFTTRFTPSRWPADRPDSVIAPLPQVILRFSRPFWPANFQGAICADSIAPEIWVNATGSQAVGTACKFRGSELQCSTDNGGAQGPAASQLEPAAAPAAWYTVTVFSTGPWADRLAALSEEGAARAVLSQLDEMFSTEPMAAAAGGSKTPASDVFDAAFRYNWADHPTIRGGYRCASCGRPPPPRSSDVTARFSRSFPSVHEQPDTRVRAAAPVGTRLFFAGEATNPKSSLTVHGEWSPNSPAPSDHPCAVDRCDGDRVPRGVRGGGRRWAGVGGQHHLPASTRCQRAACGRGWTPCGT